MGAGGTNSTDTAKLQQLGIGHTRFPRDRRKAASNEMRTSYQLSDRPSWLTLPPLGHASRNHSSPWQHRVCFMERSLAGTRWTPETGGLHQKQGAQVHPGPRLWHWSPALPTKLSPLSSPTVRSILLPSRQDTGTLSLGHLIGLEKDLKVLTLYLLQSINGPRRSTAVKLRGQKPYTLSTSSQHISHSSYMDKRARTSKHQRETCNMRDQNKTSRATWNKQKLKRKLQKC